MTSTTTVAVTARPVTTDTIASAFARAAGEHAERPAISDGRTTLTYAELAARANQIARVLVDRGLRPGQRIGVHLNRSLALYEVFLGVLTAGLVVVPFNPGHPAEHKARMRDVADPAVTVTDGVDLGRALPVAELRAAAAGAATDPMPVELVGEVDGESPAFVLFTSGSTGTPKGVVIAHRGIARVARHLTDYEPGPDDRFLQLAQPSFAASTTDIWTCLLRGGRLTVPPQDVPPLGDLARLITRERITVLNLPVGLFNLLVEHHPETIAQARSVIVSGDFPSPAHLRRALEVAGGDLFNAFGCTENSALTAVHKITAADLSGEVPVGRPMPTVEMTVRDENLAQCPSGRIGELCIAGDGLALNYLGDEELTARKFVVHQGTRLLRTGDLAKRTEGGEIVLAGRTDQMVKIRGFRVEPRHVEVTAEALPGVARAVAQAVPNVDQLVLWCVPASGQQPAERDILAHLRDRLPDYMVPSTVTVLDTLPLNANGKVDRRALAARLSGSGTGAAPRGDGLAETVRATLADVIDRPAAGVDDDLLQLGVTSLHLIDLGARLDDVVGVVLAPDELLTAGSARGVAAMIRDRRRSDA